MSVVWGDIRAECPEDGDHFGVAINGNDDTCLVRFFTTWAEALSLYNSLRYVQSNRDLAGFLPEAPGRDNSNGWPSERRILTDEFVWPPLDPWDGVDADLGVAARVGAVPVHVRRDVLREVAQVEDRVAHTQSLRPYLRPSRAVDLSHIAKDGLFPRRHDRSI